MGEATATAEATPTEDGAATEEATATETTTESDGTDGNATDANATDGNATSGNVSDENGTSGGVPEEVESYLSDANNYDGSVEDVTGQGEVTIDVGAGENGFAFGPAAVRVDAGTTVVWEWTGEGGNHNVVAQDETFRSGDPVSDAGTTFEYAFEESGVYNYFCEPHEAVGMKGSVVVE